jgi:hypothetical protein
MLRLRRKSNRRAGGIKPRAFGALSGGAEAPPFRLHALRSAESGFLLGLERKADPALRSG